MSRGGSRVLNLNQKIESVILISLIQTSDPSAIPGSNHHPG